MFAVIRTGGKQYRIQEGDILEVEKLNTKESQKVVFSEVLLIEDKENTLIGTPLVEKAQVKAEVLENFKDEKVIIFKKKRRKRYKLKRGHRQPLTRVRIDEINSGAEPSPKKPQADKKEEKKKSPKKPRAKKKAVEKEAKKEKPEKKEPKESGRERPKTKKKTGSAKKKSSKTKPAEKKITSTASKSKKSSKTKE
ncbi:MAG: 50S ribosomal protein L21 [Candidatus Aminicenantes bacterium]